MTALVWDQSGNRRYETGVDRGVLYLLSGTAVPWNGLVSIVENRSREVKPNYIDGVKYQEYVVPSDYLAKLQAYTYPEEFNSLLGDHDFAPGVTVYDQPAQRFHLSYRTHIANDLEGIDYGYRVHIVYNLIAVPSDVSFDTVGESVSPNPFEWELRGLPGFQLGIRPTCHVSLNSLRISSSLLHTVETRLYGSATVNPDLPSFTALLAMLS